MPLGAERHANADFVGSACHRVRHDAVQPDTGQHQGQHGEEARQRGNEFFLIDRLVYLFREGLKVGCG